MLHYHDQKYQNHRHIDELFHLQSQCIEMKGT